MAQKVVVRLVPKTRTSAPLLEFSFASIASSPREFVPDARRASTALNWFAERKNAEAKTTDLSRLEVEMTRSDFTKLFQRDLKPKKHTKRLMGRLVDAATFDAPDGSLKIPQELADVVEYAYLPRPIEFYGPSFRPPNESVEHVHLDDVCAALNAARAHREKRTGAGVKVAMVDSGFYPHPFFAANGYKLIASAAPGASKPEEDKSGHGTGECANIFTIAPDSTVYGVKSGPSAASSLEAAIALKPDVMSNSWGFDVDYLTRDELKNKDPNFFNELVDIETILTGAIQSGIVVVFAAGNGHRAFPGSMPHVITAGGVTLLSDGSLEASSYASSFESKIYAGRSVPDVCGIVGALGKTPMKQHIMLPVPADSELDGSNFASGAKKTGWGIFSGTSAACPQLAGAIALFREVRKGTTADQARTALVRTATDIATGKTATEDKAGPGHDLATGAGLANVRSACEFIAAIG